MKILLSILLGITSFGTAHAADIDMTSTRPFPVKEKDNVAIIRQTGGSNVIHIEQSGEENSATTEQEGKSNDVTIKQSGSKNDLKIDQQGENNKINRTQTGNSRAVIHQNGEIKEIFENTEN